MILEAAILSHVFPLSTLYQSAQKLCSSHVERKQTVGFISFVAYINLRTVFAYIHIFKQDQQDATLHNGICYYRCSTCFRRFLRPSSGAQNCIHSIGYLSRFFCFLPLSWV